MSKEKKYVSDSHELFTLKFNALLDRANKSESTIFTESIDLSKISDSMIMEHYNYFVKEYIHQFHQLDYIGKSNLINKSITESFLQDTFNKVMDTILLEGEVTLQNQYILENTVDTFGLDLKLVGKEILHSEKGAEQAIEENIFAIGAGATAFAAGVGALPALAITGILAFSMAALTSARFMNTINESVVNGTSAIIRALTAGNFSFSDNLSQSHDNILNFDNVDADPVVINMFKKIQKINVTTDIAKRGLTSIVQECVAQNRNVLDFGDDQISNQSKVGFLSGIFGPQNYNVLKLFIKAMFGQANSTNDGYNTLLRFRKCLATKLVDIYKLLLISNLQSKKDHSRILNTITKANSENPQQLLNFLPTETDEDKQLKEAILSLIMFRLHLSKLANGLENGFFEVDKEAGKFLRQKLASVDSEVENYLRLHKNKFQSSPFEGKIMDRKPSFSKSSLISKYSLTN